MEIRKIKVLEQLDRCRLQVTEGADARLDAHWKLRDCRSPFFRLYYVYDGSFWISASGRRTTLRAGHLYLVPAGLLFSAGCPETAGKLYFHCSLLRRSGYDLTAALSAVPERPVPAERVKRMRALCAQTTPAAALELQGLLLEDLTALLAESGAGRAPEPDYSEPVQQAVAYIRAQLSARLSVREVAGRLYLSEAALEKVFRRELGRTVGQYIQEMLCLEAQRRLILTETPLGRISEELGFCDQFYFSRRFRAWTGQAPSHYRKAARTKEDFT